MSDGGSRSSDGQFDHEKRLAELKKEVAEQARKAEKLAARARRESATPSRNRRGALWGVGVTVLLVVIAVAYLRFAHSSSPSAGGPNDTGVVTNGAVPPTASTSPPASPLTVSGPPANPFEDTPADKWPDGSAGIVIPTAKATGDYSASQVAYAYQTTKQMLVAALLDKQTLLGGAPTAFADLLTPQERTEFDSQLNKIGLYKNGAALSSRAWILQFAPGSTKLVTSVIKVYGTMSARPATDSHGEPVLEVDVNYRVVYAVEPPKAPADWMRIVAQVQRDVLFGDWAQASTSFSPWWDVGIAVAGARCGTEDGFAHPDYPTGPPDTVQPSGPAINPYSLSATPPNGCERTTGT